MKPTILAFAGSLRQDSYNKKLVKIAVRGAEQAGAEVTYIDLKDFPLPIYDEDIEKREGLPAPAIKLKELMIKSNGFIIASPEYNSSISGALKNTIDWVSRKATPDEKELICFIDKIALILSASPGNLGGLRGLVHLRSILENIYTFVLPYQKAIPHAMDAFDEQGHLKKADQQKAVEDLGKKLTETIVKLHA
jgi:NAD(P)H-dependent FMN reductase